MEYLFVDPSNVLYDSLQLNKGIKETLFAPSTSISFLNRFIQPDGMKELIEVLSKWNKGSYSIVLVYRGHNNTARYIMTPACIMIYILLTALFI
mmetsp:Transcript_19913/g.22795  ORF Transcript_19913/g.22795 Transcript_19913/m.22795 type:complete len:94 (+) Transcript_19913:576-857(+)